MADIHQSDLWASYMEKLGWKSGKLTKGLAYYKQLPMIGSIIKIPKIDPKVNLAEVDELAKKTKALFVKIEPLTTVKDKKIKNTLLKADFSEDSWSLQPTKTLVVDLTSSEEEILSRMEKDTRNSIRAAFKRGVKIKESNDLQDFLPLYTETAKRAKFWVISKDVEKLWEVASGKNAVTLLVAEFEGRALAACFLLFHDRTAYYYHAGSSQARRDLYATYLLVWETILASKRRGCTKLDLMGIVDPRIKATQSWSGFSHFKKGFGGSEVTYLGSFVKYYNPLIKLLFFFNRFSF